MEDSQTLLILAVVLFLGVVVPQLLRRFELPFVTSLVLLGAAVGPLGLGWVTPTDTMEFFAFVGAAFQMLLAGMEAETMHISEDRRTLAPLFVGNTLVPFMIGTGITRLFDYPWDTALFMGVVYAASSIVVAFSQIDQLGMGDTRVGRSIKSLVVVTDLAAAFGAYLIFHHRLPHDRFPLPILLGLLLSSVVVLRMFLPEVMAFFFSRFSDEDPHEPRTRLVVSSLLFIVLLYSALDVHPVVAAFLVGFALAPSPNVEEVRTKLRTIAFAIFIPIYFFIVGVHLDVGSALTREFTSLVVLVTVVGIVSVKAATGYAAARWSGFPGVEALSLAIASSTKLTFAISFGFVALASGLIDQALYAAIVSVAVLTTIVNPLVLSRLRLRAPRT